MSINSPLSKVAPAKPAVRRRKFLLSVHINRFDSYSSFQDVIPRVMLHDEASEQQGFGACPTHSTVIVSAHNNLASNFATFAPGSIPAGALP